MKEIWKNIENFEDYQISNLGRIKSFKLKKEKILNFKKNKCGYLVVGLYNDKQKNKKILVHRLVAEAFLNKNDFKYMPYENNINLNELFVNHIDGNKENNKFDNLEWCTQSYNEKHAYKIKIKKAKKNNENIFSKNINQYDLNDKFIKTWANKREIQRNLGFDNSNIVKCCIGKQKTAYGYKWEYKEG